MLPLGLGTVEDVTHDYIRKGTRTLFAALDGATGKVLAQSKRRHRHQEFLSFLQQVDRNVASSLDMHLMIDNSCTHKPSKVKEWVEQRPRFHLHCTPHLGLMDQSSGTLVWHHDPEGYPRRFFPQGGRTYPQNPAFVEHDNAQVSPCMWVARAESMLAKIQRLG